MINLGLLCLIIYLIDDLRTITKMKSNLQVENGNSDSMPIKNLFVIGIFGYIILETTSI